ncbi:hypothetical protein [Nonomuraea insulae]|uniref:Uncharacterized protein n=1 Tax=Nonomuraea insulae TaxID=1616787 RepID=A0ABW1D842_9ACTN
MRGQEPGSEHDRREADRSAAPATPPPSFGQTDRRDVPAASTPTDEAGDAEPHPAIPTFQGSPSDPDGAPPWEVPGDDAAPYDWFSDPTHPDFAPPEPPPDHHPLTPPPFGHPQATTPHPPFGTPEPDHPPFSAPEPARPPFGTPEATGAPFTPPEDTAPPGTPRPGHPPFGKPGSDHQRFVPPQPDHQQRTRAQADHKPFIPPQAGQPFGAPETDHPWSGARTHAETEEPSGTPATDRPFGRPETDRPWPAPPQPTQAESDHPWPAPPQPTQAESDHPWPAPPQPTQAETDQTRPGRLRDVRSWNEPNEEPTQQQVGQQPGHQFSDQSGHQSGSWPVEPVVPGAPPWEPPPAFTAAAAGMPVWPAPITDPHAMPPWPAATGELVAEPDADEPSLPPPFDPNATNPEGFTRPAHYFDPDAAKRDAAEHPDTPHQGAEDTAPGHPSGTQPHATKPSQPTPGPSDRPDQGHEHGHPIRGHEQGHPIQGHELGHPSQGHPTPGHEQGRPTQGHEQGHPTHGHEQGHPAQGHDRDHFARGHDRSESTQSTDPDLTAALSSATDHDPTHVPAETSAEGPSDQKGPNTPEPAKPRPTGSAHPAVTKGTRKPPLLPAPVAGNTTRPAHYFDPNATTRDTAPQPSIRPPEPGDVPVWPPIPPTGDKLPELPFSRDTWGQKPSTSFDLPTPPTGGPAFPPGAFKQPPFQTQPPPPPPAKSKRALLVTLGALALAGVATGGFFAYQAVSAPQPTTAAARATASAPPPTITEESAAPPADVPGASVLNSEQTDPQKLSLSEAFPKKKVSAAGTTFTRVKADMETTCDKAATGAFADALKEQKCSRVLRATYVDSKRRYAVTTGIAVLPDKDAAATADQAKDLSRNIWFRSLPGAAGSGGERVHMAGGYAAGLLWGRYIVFSYATHADGHTPASKEKTLPKVSGAFRDQTSLVLERRITTD